jgi:hypothetical protein
MFTIEYALNPVYTKENAGINLKVKFKEFTEEMPFHATSNDPHDHGKELYERALNGEFGEIQPYVAPPELELPSNPSEMIQNNDAALEEKIKELVQIELAKILEAEKLEEK